MSPRKSPADSEFLERLARFRRNGQWLSGNWQTFMREARGKYLAISEGEVFISEDWCEAKRLANERHPDDVPYIQYIPLDDRPRIYAC